MSEISSQIGGNLGPLYQQGIDAYGIQREIVIHQRTNLPASGKSYYTFNHELSIYMHPGMRREFVVKANWRDRLKPPAEVKKLALRLDELSRHPRDWFQFHNFAMQSDSLKGVLYLLKRFGV
jgi:hypothetical protein